MVMHPVIIKVLTLSVIGVLFLSLPCTGAENSTYVFLRNDASARAAGLGGSFVSIVNDPNGIFVNPAIIGTLDSREISIGFFKNLVDINAGNACYGQHVEDFGWVGAGIQYVNYGSMTQTDESGNRLGTFSANDLALTVNYSNLMYDNLTYGINAKFIFSSIAEYRSTAIAFDVGLLYSMPEKLLTFGLSATNIGRQTNSYIDTREALPFNISIGVSKQLEHLPLLMCINFHRLNDADLSFIDHLKSFSLGGEFTLSSVIKLRVGYNNQRRQDLKLGTSSGMAGFSLGGSIFVKGYVVDYAYNSFGAVGATHRISLSTSF
jgi:hypothetical protein